MSIMRECKECKESKELNMFSKCNTCQHKVGHVCKLCRSKKTRASQMADPKFDEKNRIKATKNRKENNEEFKLSVRMSNYKKLGLDITKEQYRVLYEKSGNMCEICGKEPTGFKKILCLDHCHDTNKVRGFLCDNCNAGLGKFHDDLDKLERAINYLKKHK